MHVRLREVGYLQRSAPWGTSIGSGLQKLFPKRISMEISGKAPAGRIVRWSQRRALPKPKLSAIWGPIRKAVGASAAEIRGYWCGVHRKPRLSVLPRAYDGGEGRPHGSEPHSAGQKASGWKRRLPNFGYVVEDTG
jgi:hypothetical protein